MARNVIVSLTALGQYCQPQHSIQTQTRDEGANWIGGRPSADLEDLLHVSFDQFRHHHNNACILLPHHGPEFVHGGAQRALCDNVLAHAVVALNQHSQ
jgi:hypothetical protein